MKDTKTTHVRDSIQFEGAFKFIATIEGKFQQNFIFICFWYHANLRITDACKRWERNDVLFITTSFVRKEKEKRFGTMDNIIVIENKSTNDGTKCVTGSGQWSCFFSLLPSSSIFNISLFTFTSGLYEHFA